MFLGFEDGCHTLVNDSMFNIYEFRNIITAPAQACGVTAVDVMCERSEVGAWQV